MAIAVRSVVVPEALQKRSHARAGGLIADRSGTATLRIVDEEVVMVIVEIPKGKKAAGFERLRELEEFANSDKERKLLMMYRAFRLVGTPYILPPGTPKPQVHILQEAMRKAYKDPDFHKDFKKLAGFDTSPLMPEEQEKVIRDLPRDKETIELFKKLSGPDPMPVR